MRNIRNSLGAAALLLLFGAAGCADLDVTNPNNPSRELALATPGDVQALITGSFRQWWLGQYSYDGASLFLSTQSFQHSATPNNACMVPCSAIPRPPLRNDQVDQYYGNMTYTWQQSYRALAAVADGMRTISTDEEVRAELEDELATIETLALFVQGLGHASVAVLYEEGFVLDETVDVIEDGEFVNLGEPIGYNALMDEAMSFFDQALARIDAAAAAGEEIEIDEEWLGVINSLDGAELEQLIHSLKARYMAAVARTPEERENLAWETIIEEAQAGHYTTSLRFNMDYVQSTWDFYPAWAYMGFQGWHQINYFIHGMADQSGNYQAWLDKPVFERKAIMDLDGDGTEEPVLIITPDQRFAQGSTIQEQQANSSGFGFLGGPPYIVLPNGSEPSYVNYGDHFSKPERGTWRWSMYFDYRPFWRWALFSDNSGYPPTLIQTVVNDREMRLLAAEGMYRVAGNTVTAEAAAIVDETRVGVGQLDPSADGVNDACVPKLPSEACGGFFEMLKWEKRLMSYVEGPMVAGWYFDGRGWGDLYAGTQLHFPFPAEEAVLLGLSDPYGTTGGLGGDAASDGSTYDFPFEGGSN